MQTTVIKTLCTILLIFFQQGVAFGQKQEHAIKLADIDHHWILRARAGVPLCRSTAEQEHHRYVATCWTCSLMTTLNATALEIESLIELWRARFHDLDAALAHAKPDADRWSIAEVVGHLVDSACNNHQRFVRAQHCSDFVFPKYEQNDWVDAANYRESNWESLVELWYHYNRQLAVLIRNVSSSSLSNPCTITPYEPCTRGFLVTDYLDHLKHHFTILSGRMAR